MELLSPAGNVEKLYYAYAYGADAAYIGLKKFSLRVKADNFYEDEYKKVIELKNKFPGKKLHCALNICFHNNDIDNFLRSAIHPVSTLPPAVSCFFPSLSFPMHPQPLSSPAHRS